MTARAPKVRRPRVVFVDHVARLSGGEIALLRLLPALAGDVDVHVVLGEEGPLVERLRVQGISVEVLPLAPALRDLRKDTLRPSRFDPMAAARVAPYVARLARRIRARRADLVHTNSLKAALYGGAAGRLARVPVIWHLRDRIADDYLPHSAVMLVRAAARVLPTAVVANSRATLDTLPRVQPARVVYNPIVPDSVGHSIRAAAARTDACTTDRDHRSSRPLEGPARLPRGICGSVPRHAGARSRDRQRPVRRRCLRATPQRSRRNVSESPSQIEFRGFREDVQVELAELDMLVHSSVIPEPFGQAVLEGMAAGIPVIATDAGGPAELITNGRDGILTQPGDAHELAEALRRLESDAALREALGSEAMRRSMEFTPERTAERLLGVYREVLST